MTPRRISGILIALFAALTLFAPTLAAAAPPAAPQAMEIMGGQHFRTATAGRCTTGFSVEHTTYGHGFLAYGGCGQLNDPVYAADGSVIGVVKIKSAAWLWVDLAAGWTALPYVAPNHPVTGGAQSPVGASVCRAGSTTGWHCGIVQALNQTVSYPGGVLYGLTRTNVCAEPGDTGGPYLSGGNAQGIHVGGSGNCASGGTSFFQPLRPIFAAYPSLSLMTV
ncbi:S1 family peptidase [Stackebrandtia albiflava]|uniref:S1 family peptidase n=1 Tax=Stackebrandtia albiflava TaxID=406432 RepID=UPI0011BE5220|nr:S1 family peptidase [Stackebrandtia albiflava]